MNNEKIILDEFTELYERSKDDHASKMIVGSEVRNLIGIIRNERARIAVLQIEIRAWRDWDANCGVELHPDNIEGCSCEGVNRVENVLNARQATDAAKGLE